MCDKLDVKLMNGRVISTRRDELVAVVLHPVTIGIIAAYDLTVITLDVFGALAEFEPWQQLLILVSSNIAVIACILGSLYFGAATLRKPIASIFLSIVGALASTIISQIFLWFNGWDFDSLYQLAVFFIFWVFLIEIF